MCKRDTNKKKTPLLATRLENEENGGGGGGEGVTALQKDAQSNMRNSTRLDSARLALPLGPIEV